MAKKPAAKKAARRGSDNMIISKSRTKACASINVSGEFYSALDAKVREMISDAQKRATDNGRRTLRPYDL